MACGIVNELPDMPIQFAQGDEFNITITVNDFRRDAFGNEIQDSETRADLTGAVITHRVTDVDGNELWVKVSTNSAEIEINPDQTTESTKGTALLKYVEADTEPPIDHTTERWHYAKCVFADGRKLRVVKRSRFILDL